MNLRKTTQKAFAVIFLHSYPNVQQKTKNSTHESNNRTFIPFIEPLTPKSPLQIAVSSVALCFTPLGRVPFSITSRILKPEPWALELGISVSQSGNSARLGVFRCFFFPQTWTQWITQRGKDNVVGKAKWMASRWTEERMAMHRMHSDVRATNAPNCQTTEDLKSCQIHLNPLHRDPYKASATFGNPQVPCAQALLHPIKRGPGRAGRGKYAADELPSRLQSHDVEFNSAVTLSS